MSLAPSLNPGLGSQSAIRVTPGIVPFMMSLLMMEGMALNEGELPSPVGAVHELPLRDIATALLLYFRALADARDAVDGLPALAEGLAQVGFHVFFGAQGHFLHRRDAPGGEGLQHIIVPESQVF